MLYSHGWLRRPAGARYSQTGREIWRGRFLESMKNSARSTVWPTVLRMQDATGHIAPFASFLSIRAIRSDAGADTTRPMRLPTGRETSRQIPFCRAIVGNVTEIDGPKGAFARGFLHSMRGETDNARNDKKRAAVPP